MVFSCLHLKLKLMSISSMQSALHEPWYRHGLLLLARTHGTDMVSWYLQHQWYWLGIVSVLLNHNIYFHYNTKTPTFSFLTLQNTTSKQNAQPKIVNIICKNSKLYHLEMRQRAVKLKISRGEWDYCFCSFLEVLGFVKDV